MPGKEALMTKCGNCGTDNPPTATYCVNCGVALTPLPLPSAITYQPPATATSVPNRGGLPIVAVVVMAILILTLMIWMVSSLFSGPASKTVSISGDRAPDLILADADAALNKVNAMRYSMDASFSNLPGAGDKPIQLALSGEIVRPDRYTMRGADVGEVLVVGDNSWQRRDASAAWVKRAGSSGIGGLIDPSALADSSQYYTNVMRLSDEIIGGVDCYHLKFDVDAAKLAAASSGLDLGKATIAAEVWVGKADSLQRQMQLLIKLPTSSGNISGTMRIGLSSFNDPITITPPIGL